MMAWPSRAVSYLRRIGFWIGTSAQMTGDGVPGPSHINGMLSAMNDSTHANDRIVVREAATLALLRDADDGLEVLLLRRHPGHVFAANACVFPGGACDAGDSEALGQVASGAGLADAAYRIAAIRECFEEAGLLVALSGTLPNVDACSRLRRALNAGELSWQDLLAQTGLQMALPQLLPFASWTTPVGAPKRYATRFFAAIAPADQIAEADGAETVSARWLRPAEALIDADTGRRHLMRPTRATLEILTQFEDAQSALAGLAAQAVEPS